MFHAGEMGGGLTLAAMRIPEADFRRVTEQVNSFPEVAHNYRREHELNMWFVLATETPEGITETIQRIEQDSHTERGDLPSAHLAFVHDLTWRLCQSFLHREHHYLGQLLSARCSIGSTSANAT